MLIHFSDSSICLSSGVMHPGGYLLHSLVFGVSPRCLRAVRHIDTLLQCVCTFLSQYHHFFCVYMCLASTWLSPVGSQIVCVPLYMPELAFVFGQAHWWCKNAHKNRHSIIWNNIHCNFVRMANCTNCSR